MICIFKESLGLPSNYTWLAHCGKWPEHHPSESRGGSVQGGTLAPTTLATCLPCLEAYEAHQKALSETALNLAASAAVRIGSLAREGS